MEIVADEEKVSFQVSAVFSMYLTWIRLLRLFGFAIAAYLSVIGMTPGRAQEITIRVGHFPNITHVQALVARNFERHGQSWFAPRLGSGVKVEWYAYNAGPSTMEAIFAESLDLTYVGPIQQSMLMHVQTVKKSGSSPAR